MDKKTQENLQHALSGESQAHIRYLTYADIAEKEGKVNVARLFKAIAFAEKVHAVNHLNALGGVGNTIDNLTAAIAGETYEVEKMYPEYYGQAKECKEEDAA